MSNKYGAKKTMIDGITFDSKKEAHRYVELKVMESDGKIKGLELQPEYELVPKFRKNGKSFRSIKYRADFRYIEDGDTVIEDVKGKWTEVFKIKRKLFEWRYPELSLRIT